MYNIFTLYDDTSHFCKRTVLKVLCYKNIYVEKHGRNLHVHIFIGDNHGE